MGLLYYKAHCSTVNDDTTYGCATRDEMISFINNQEVHLRMENGNLVVHFKPFSVKYLNYLKKYNGKKPSRVLRSENNQGIKVIRNNSYQVYIQLFRLSRRASKTFDAPTYVASLWHCKNNEEGHSIAKDITKFNSSVSTCSSYNSRGTPWLNFRTRFKYCLTVQDAKRGYMVVLRNVSKDSASIYHRLILNYGTSTDETGNLIQGSYDFHYGLVAGIVGPQGGPNFNVVYNPIEEDITHVTI